MERSRTKRKSKEGDNVKYPRRITKCKRKMQRRIRTGRGLMRNAARGGAEEGVRKRGEGNKEKYEILGKKRHNDLL